MTTTQGLSVTDIAKSFGDTVALAGVTVAVEPGEVLAVTGPSGAGKTTFCRLVSGLELADRGEIRLGGRDLRNVPADRRRVSYLFESYALFPHMTVFENTASPLRVPGRRNLSSGDLTEQVQAVLGMLAIDHLQARFPSELSGGQKQRVGLARALVQDDASITLLDEPISHLDAKLRHRLRGEIKRTLAARGAPAIWSTPDGLEALAVGDRVAVIIDGKLEQLGTPQEIWEFPASVRVARLIGDPPISMIAGSLATGPESGLMTLDGVRLPLPEKLVERLLETTAGAPPILGIMPRAIHFSSPDHAAARFEVETVEPFGKHTVVSVRVGAHVLRAKTAGVDILKAGDIVGLDIDDRGITVFDGRTGNALASKPGGDLKKKAFS